MHDAVGRERTSEDVLSVQRARLLAATLGLDPAALEDGAPLPPGWHWVYFNEAAPRSALGPDGHERRGDFLPALPLARRMWAGGRLTFPGTLRLGEPATRVSTMRSVEQKHGRSGPLVFVTVEHLVTGPGGVATEEEQSLVYRDVGSTGGAAPRVVPPGEAEWREPFTADEATLFRFSALTFNAHRIHYDHPYATGTEGYPGLVVHGPLLALLLLGAGARRAGTPSEFRYRAKQPLFCGEAFELAGRRSGDGKLGLWAEHQERGVAMEAELESG